MISRILLATIFGCFAVGVSAQQPTEPKSPAPPPAATNKKDKPKEIPPSENVTLETKDRVNLHCTWFPGVHQKESAAVILIHDWKSSRQSLLPLAQKLQKDLGCAVIVPDLRGHGDSVHVVGGNLTIDPEKFGKADFPAVIADIEACKKFLIEKHNLGELNIELLTVLACHRTTPLAVTWAVADWSWPPLAGKKQGQDVKLLILLTPLRRFESVNLSNVLKAPVLASSQVDGITTAMFWDPLQATSEKEASLMDTALSKGLGPQPAIEVADRWDRIRLIRKTVETGGTGEELLGGDQGVLVLEEIAGVIKSKLVDRRDKYLWQDRSTK